MIRRVLLAACLTVPFWDLGHPLWEVDDARYAEVPREMAEGGDWLTPRLNGMEYVEKPPLWFWLGAASYKVFGISEAAARLPLAALSLLGVGAVLWAGTWLFGPSTAAAAAAVLSSSGLWFLLSHGMTVDLPLAVFLTWGVAFALRALLRPEDARWAAPAAWTAAALAFLSKGLIALVLPGAWVLVLLWAVPRLRAGLPRLFHPAGPAIFAALTLPWALALQERHGDFFQVFFLEQHFQRFLTAKYNRPGPWYYYFVWLPVGLLPWTPAALHGFFSALKNPDRGSESAAAAKALALWAAVVVLFFSTSRSKLLTYALPAVPALCLLAARVIEEDLPAWSRKLAVGVAVLAAAGAALGPILLDHFAPERIDAGASWLLSGALAALAAGLLLYRKLRPQWIVIAACGLFSGALGLGAARRAEDRVSVRPLARSAAERLKPGDLVYSYGTYPHGLSFYLGRRVDRMIYWIGELHVAKRYSWNDGRFGDDNDIRALPLPGRTVFVTMPEKEGAHFRSLIDLGKLKGWRRFGGWVLAEL